MIKQQGRRFKQTLQNEVNNEIIDYFEIQNMDASREIDQAMKRFDREVIEKIYIATRHMNSNPTGCYFCKVDPCTLTESEFYCNQQMIQIKGDLPNLKIKRIDKPIKSIDQMLGFS